MANRYLCVYYNTQGSKMQERKIVTNIRLNASTFQKMEQLREFGFNPATIMRRAIEQALAETLEKAKKAGI